MSKSSKSGYDLRYTVESSEDNIAHKGVFLVAFGLRYKSYCANVGRTFIVDPTPVSHFASRSCTKCFDFWNRNKKSSMGCWCRFKQKFWDS